MEDLTPMMKQYHEVKRRFPGKLVLFRLGDFYEMFFEDAVIASRELEITLTSRNKDRSGAPIPMCGVPFHSVDGYVARLLKKGYKIALCDQVEDPRAAKGLVHREVTRILTPGTVVEEMLLEPKDHNFLAGLVLNEEGCGLALLDLTTSDFLTTEFQGPDAWDRVLDEILRFRPREILLAESSGEEIRRRLAKDCPGDDWVTSPVDPWVFNPDYARRLLLEHLGVASLEGFGCDGKNLAVSAAGALVHYLRETQMAQAGRFAALRFYEPSSFLKLDASTVANLELVQTLEGSRKGSLLHLLDRTRTGMGGRLLKTWLLSPLTDRQSIEQRLDSVAEMTQSVEAHDRLARKLAGVHDLERLISRTAVGVVTPRELVSLKDSLRAVPSLRDLLSSRTAARIREMSEMMDPVMEVVEIVERALPDDPPNSPTDPGVIRAGYSKELDELRAIQHSGKAYLAALEARERKRTGIQSLKVKYNQVFGYFIEVTKPNLPQVPPDYIRRQTLVNCERFVTDELRSHEERILSAEERISTLERDLYAEVKRSVALESERVQRTARLLGELDAYVSLAEVAMKQGFVRPAILDTDEIRIRQGRHPVIELQSRPFIPNDLLLNGDDQRLIILTGPNMGGKSTYLRQAALIVILAQMGAFVPASEARIGLADRIYTRVGASDNLARGRSTFMVEMIETANILNTATSRSLILLDEVGRGTATFDGLSIAWAVAEYLVQDPSRRARTLFATHYHELTKLSKLHPCVKNFCMAVQEAGREIVFLRKVQPGVADRSYGIEVARLAGLPREVLQRAGQILERLEKKEIDLTGKRSRRPADDVLDEIQGSLF